MSLSSCKYSKGERGGGGGGGGVNQFSGVVMVGRVGEGEGEGGRSHTLIHTVLLDTFQTNN